MKRSLLKFLLFFVFVAALIPALAANADYEDGMECPVCHKWRWDDYVACDECGMCEDCIEDWHFCPGCGDCAWEKEQCEGCDYCEDCVLICDECGEKCTNCSDDSMFCANCNRCEDCNGGTVCPGCGETCGECEVRDQCGECEYCTDCADLCPDCGKTCTNCETIAQCDNCLRCADCNADSICPGCGETCFECEAKQQCGNCYLCSTCADVCEDCEEHCSECDDEFCMRCGTCSSCNGDTTCPDCHENCEECNDSFWCQSCNRCDNCAIVCENCGEMCSECDDGFCLSCGLCSDCNGGTACPDCHESCLECAAKEQCRECFLCEDCTVICSDCGAFCIDCDSAFCRGCNTCSDCNGDTACPDCYETCLNCNSKPQCTECYLCADETIVCQSCGELCVDCDSGFCNGCETCSNCNGDTACPDCHESCLECSSAEQCPECLTCENCADICLNCGLRCASCDPLFDDENGLCSSCSELTITRQPKNAVVYSGESAAFSIAMKGNNLRYQWQVLSAADGSTWTGIQGATANSYVVPAGSVVNGDQYRCLVTNSDGESVTSDAAKVSIQTREVYITELDAPVPGVAFDTDAVSSIGDVDYVRMTVADTEVTGSGKTNTRYGVGVMLYFDRGSPFQGVAYTPVAKWNGLTSSKTLRVGQYRLMFIFDYNTEGFSITAQPKDVLTAPGNTATFSVQTNGSDLTYQWQYRKPGGSWTNCTSATTGYNTASLKVAAENKRNGYQYRCQITNVQGMTSASAIAKLTVTAPTITTQPKSVSVSQSETAKFSVKAEGMALKCQWQYRKPGGSWTNCTSATSGYRSATLKVAALSNGTNRNGYQYRCIVTDSLGTKVTSGAAKLTVVPISITAQPKNATITRSSTATISVAAEGSGLTYQWQYKKPGNDWKNCTSATEGYQSTLLKVVGESNGINRNGFQYRCVITDKSGNTLTSGAAKLTVQALGITTQPKDAVVTKSGTAVFTVKADGVGVRYQWQYKKSGGDWKNCTSATEGYNTAKLKVAGESNGVNRSGFQYRCVITDSSSNKVISKVVTLTVNALSITEQPKNASVTKSGTASFTVKADGSGLKYQWQYKKSGGSWTNCTSATTGYRSATLKVAGESGSTNRNNYQYRCIVTDSAGKQVTSDAARLTVKALTITTQPKSASGAQNSTVSFTVKADGSGLKYQWQYKKAGGSWTNCTSATTGYNAATLKVAADGKRSGYQYRCIVKSGSEQVTSNAASLTVKTLKIITQPKSSTITRSAKASFTVKADGVGIKYQWQYKKPGGSWTDCTSATTGYNAATLTVAGISGDLNRSGYQYRCIVTDGAGTKVTSNIVKLTVKDLGFLSYPKSATTKADGKATFTVKADGVKVKYQWQYKKPGGSWVNCTSATTGYNTASLTVAGASGSVNRNSYEYRCVITDNAGNKDISTPAKLTVN